MVKVAICDDQYIFQETIRNKLNLLLKKEFIKAEIDCYDSGKKLIEYLKVNKNTYDILFLDILMNDINGVDVAKEIRTFDSRIQIIFLTSSSDYILQGYDVEALGYLIKGQEDKKLEEVFLKAIKKVDKNFDDYLILKSGNYIRTVYLKEIEFIEVRNRTLTINAGDETIDFNGKMEDMQNELLCKNFILTHRSYLVNLRKIKHISTSSIELKSGKEVLLSRLRSKEVKKAYLDYIFEYNKEE
ncbi:LytTR family DNA-binding domain-containing protein [Clostridium sp.]|uniref:LytR/AlgR family response regulator transcription factor n=1 Tax=Clostridium sp. TaxID=1506 RepID=UPI0025BB1E7C|nr:LytTR family DNA-binding domain-containing protein [Clostridium sp.]